MDFFATTGTGEKGFAMFDAVHCSWLAGIALMAVLLCVIHRRLGSKGRRIMQRAVALTTMAVYLSRQLMLIIIEEYDVFYLPLHLCGMSIYIEAIDCLFPNRFTRELCYAVCMPGALMGVLYANWGNMPLGSYISITSFVLHGIMIIYPLLAITGGDHRPSPRRLPWCFGFLAAVSVPVYFFNRHFGTNYMFLAKPSAGSPLELFEKWFGNPGYLLGFVIMIAIVWAVMYLPFALIEAKERRLKKASQQEGPYGA